MRNYSHGKNIREEEMRRRRRKMLPTREEERKDAPAVATLVTGDVIISTEIKFHARGGEGEIVGLKMVSDEERKSVR